MPQTKRLYEVVGWENEWDERVVRVEAVSFILASEAGRVLIAEAVGCEVDDVQITHCYVVREGLKFPK